MKNSITVLCAFALLFYIASCTSNSSQNKTITADTTSAKCDTSKAMYVCPMDSDVTSTHPDTCYKCGMDLEKVIKN